MIIDEDQMLIRAFFFAMNAGMNLLRVIFVLALSVPASRAAELDPLLDDARLWQSDATSIASQHRDLQIAWVSSDHQSAKIIGTNTLFEMPVVDAVMQMNGDKPTEISLVLYDRGDSGEIPRERFVALVSNAQQRIGASAAGKPVPATDQLKTTGVRRDGLTWTNATTSTRLLWSYSTKDATGHFAFRPEYVKVQIAPLGAHQNSTAAAAATVSTASLKTKIKHDAGGDVLLTGVPMVDQGEKGYCAVATAERVMRFYGMDIDQHELAQLAASSAQGGTDPRTMLEALRRAGIKLGCKVKVLQDFSVQEFVHFIDRYNQAARKKRLAEIKLGNEIDIAAIYGKMDTAILRDIRTKPPAGMKTFLADITKNVDQAIPVLWGVQLGKVAEKPALPKQTVGGHLRLIIGYNPKTSEILYTDSWGPGHELKRMALDDAWTITCSLYLIEPRHTVL